MRNLGWRALVGRRVCPTRQSTYMPCCGRRLSTWAGTIRPNYEVGRASSKLNEPGHFVFEPSHVERPVSSGRNRRLENEEFGFRSRWALFFFERGCIYMGKRQYGWAVLFFLNQLGRISWWTENQISKNTVNFQIKTNFNLVSLLSSGCPAQCYCMRALQ